MLTQVIPRAVFNNALVAALFGVLVPYWKSFEFLDTILLLMYALFGMFFTAPRVVDAASGAALRRGPFFRAVLSGWGLGLVIFWLGIATVSLKVGSLLTPPPAVYLTLAVLSLAACLFAGAVAARVAAAVPSAETAKSRMRIGFFGFLVALLGVPRLLDEDATVALAGLLTPEGLVRLTLVAAPLLAVGTVVLLAGYRRRPG